ncbi:hypothetical protein BC830DRAFT_1115404 [Chytriomyces sp. MP71]|nr:hypothetical protein BC830DRAFT_1115404 [Chytriomyces sp. MP71]
MAVSSDTFQSKLIASLEERLATAEQLRCEEVRAQRLLVDATQLLSRAKQLRRLLLDAGVALPEAPTLFALNVAGVGEEDDEDEVLGGGKLPQIVHSTINGFTSELTPWHLIVRKLYPGQISHLRQHQRNLIDQVVHDEYLVPRLGVEEAKKCLVTTGVTGSTAYYCIPPALLDGFGEWFGNKLDVLVTMDEFSANPKRKRPSMDSPIFPAHEMHDPVNGTSTHSKPRTASTGAGSGGVPSTSLTDSTGTLNYGVKPTPRMFDGSVNVEGYRTWVDIVRGRYPSFGRTSSHMCRVAAQFCDRRGIVKRLCSSVTGVNSHRPAFGLPENLQLEFLSYLESHFLKQDGSFGTPDMHTGAGTKTGASEEEEEEDEEEDEDGDGDGEGMDDDEEDAGMARLEETSEDAEDDEDEDSGDEVMPVSKRPRGGRRGSAPVRHEAAAGESLESLAEDKDWRAALTAAQRAFLSTNSKHTSMLLRIRNGAKAFVKKKCLGAGLPMIESMGEVRVPEEFVDEFRAWFEEARGEEEAKLGGEAVAGGEPVAVASAAGPSTQAPLQPNSRASAVMIKLPEMASRATRSMSPQKQPNAIELNDMESNAGDTTVMDVDVSLIVDNHGPLDSDESTHAAMAIQREPTPGLGMSVAGASAAAELEASSATRSTDVSATTKTTAQTAAPIPIPQLIATTSVLDVVPATKPHRAASKSPKRSATAESQDSLQPDSKPTAVSVAVPKSLPAPATTVFARLSGASKNPKDNLMLVQPGQQTIIGNTGLTLTKYNYILFEILPDFRKLPEDSRIAVKRGVKLFLQQEMKDRFHDCMFQVEGASHHSYGIPQHLKESFRAWAVAELTRCFPDKVVVKA